MGLTGLREADGKGNEIEPKCMSNEDCTALSNQLQRTQEKVKWNHGEWRMWEVGRARCCYVLSLKGEEDTQTEIWIDRKWKSETGDEVITNRTGKKMQGNDSIDKKFHFMRKDLEISICFILGHCLIKRTVLRWLRTSLLMFWFMNRLPK